MKNTHFIFYWTGKVCKWTIFCLAHSPVSQSHAFNMQINYCFALKRYIRFAKSTTHALKTRSTISFSNPFQKTRTFLIYFNIEYYEIYKTQKDCVSVYVQHLIYFIKWHPSRKQLVPKKIKWKIDSIAY